MKSKDYFAKLKETGKIDKEEYTKFLETVPDFEVPDPVFQILDSTFLTTDRAITHEKVHGKIMSQVLDTVEKDISEMLKHLPADRVMDIEKEKNTYKRLQMVKESLPIAIQKASKAPNDEEAKKKLQESQATIQELTEKFSKLSEESETNKKTLHADYEGKIKNYRLDSELEKMANSYTFADGYKETRATITKALLGEIRQKHKLDLVETDGEPQIPVLDEHGRPRFENNGNTPVTIKSLLDGTFKPFLKVSNPDEQKDQQSQQHQATKSFVVNGQQQTASRSGASVTAIT